MKPKLIVMLFLHSFAMHAAHLVGGEISYTCNGNNNYTITLKVYRDCNSSGAQFDPQALIYAYNSSGTVEKSMSVFLLSSSSIPAKVDNPCLQTPPNVCTEVGTYVTTVYLPPKAGGYTLTYQRCCRNQTITNIANPSDWGSTYTIDIPSNDSSCNSSASFLNTPPIVLCLNDSLNFNSSVSEPDGDSVFYELCNPLHGGSKNDPAPSPLPPPYMSIPFATGYSTSSPIASSPNVTIDQNTGVIRGTPTQIGQFAFAICVKEYRKGVLLSTLRRDYQFNVVNCVSQVTATINSQVTFCGGKTISFNNTSWNATKYWWDFGDPNSTSDTSTSGFPTYTYSDTGTYRVRFIVNKGWQCSDSDYIDVKVHYPVVANYLVHGDQCVDAQDFIFMKDGDYSSNARYFWYFGKDANLEEYRDSVPPPISFTKPGKYYVTLQIEDFGCSDLFGDTIKVYARPEAAFGIQQQIGCHPFTAVFENQSLSSTDLMYEWEFGDGETSQQENPRHVYKEPGVYSVRLTAYTTEGCIDTSYFIFPDAIIVNPSPSSEMVINPMVTSIYKPEVEVVIPEVKANEHFWIHMGDGSVYENQRIVDHSYIDTGKYQVWHIVSNEFNCWDSSSKEVWIQPELNLFVPNAFSPNDDGVNDIFKPSITGTTDYEFQIFNRWGEVVFHTKDPHEGWNGRKHNSGEVMPLGVYSYTINVLDLNYKYQNKTGFLRIIK